MPRIADRIALIGFKPTTRDKKKRQTEFIHEPSFTLEDMVKAVKALEPLDTSFDTEVSYD
jgi:hypothetical protein